MGPVACLRVAFDSGVCDWSEIAPATPPAQKKALNPEVCIVFVFIGGKFFGGAAFY